MKRLVVLSALLVGCGGAVQVVAPTRVSDAERMHTAMSNRDVAKLAPEIFARAEAELALAKQAHASGDTASEELHAERAVATFNLAVASARLATATRDEAEANEGQKRAEGLAAKYAAARKAAELEVEAADKQLKIAKQATQPAPSGAADAERERARGVAARALVAQARLLCGAARLVSTEAPGLAEAESAVVDLEKKGDAVPAPIDGAARARVGCLASLTRARRTSAQKDVTDTLLAELSQARATDTKGADLAPARDERGVVVTLHNAWNGDKPSAETEATLKDLGRVAAAHPAFGVQVVLHDATPSDISLNRRRGANAERVLLEAGGPKGRVHVEIAGTHAPVIDPKDTARQGRNARLEIVFVSPGS